MERTYRQRIGLFILSILSKRILAFEFRSHFGAKNDGIKCGVIGLPEENLGVLASWREPQSNDHQAGTGRPALRPESMPQNGRNLQPEAAGRSRWRVPGLDDGQKMMDLTPASLKTRRRKEG